ncbi:MAG: two-component sensor histidine kinase, partial [Leptospiraceae bacterium]|nr:two-component sensor histidine kinase [Leptospiraceae bacterium]
LQDKAKAINVGDSPQTNVMTGITELADLSDSIEKMYKRIRGQFIDLELEKEKFNLVLQNLKEGVFAFDNSGNILFQNSSVPKGLVQENSGMRNIEAAIKNRSFLDFLKEHMDSNKEGKISIQIRKKHYSIRLYVLKQNQSACIFIAVILDKTEEKERQMMRELFVQSASHELKTPITSIKGYTETLSYKLKLPENSNENRFLSAIIRNTDRMVRIINDMLTISKLENSLSNFQPEEFELNELIDRMKFTLDGILNPKQQKLILKIPSNLRIYADNILLEHLLLNLLQNASMYSPAKKNIYIIAESEKDKVKIKIKDGGIGIPESEKKRIFERFYRVDKDRSREQGGTGLGLSIVKHIVNLHDGWIEVESKEEKGSTFIVNLPQER